MTIGDGAGAASDGELFQTPSNERDQVTDSPALAENTNVAREPQPDPERQPDPEPARMSHAERENRKRQSWNRLQNKLDMVGASNFDVNGPECQVPGASSASVTELDRIRRVYCHLFCMAHLLHAVLKYAPEKLDILSNGVQQSVGVGRQESELPGRPIVTVESRESMLSAMAYVDDNNKDVLNPCFSEWTTVPGLARNLLSPAYMVLYVWIGRGYCPQLLSFPFAFAVCDGEFGSAWDSSPVKTSADMFKFLKEDAHNRRTSAEVNSPGAALVKIAIVLEPKLYTLARAMHNVCLARDLVVEVASRGYEGLVMVDLFKAQAVQYMNCSTPVVTQVQSALPTKTSLPCNTTNFVDDKSSSWFRTAEYVFGSIKMPDIARSGSAPKQLAWHRYASDVLHARQNCSNLSERQVIQHLSNSITRQSSLYAVSQDARSRSDMTVSMWLDIVRDFYFTSGQFRYHVESSWQQYDITDAKDFNDLIHHIRTYWQLIFLDYFGLDGKQSKIEFACHLFSKLQYLRQHGSHTTLGSVSFMYISTSALVEWWHNKLCPMCKEHESVSNPVGEEFVNWVLTELMRARESANTIQRFSTVQSTTFDFAKTWYQDKSRAVQPAQGQPVVQPQAPATPRYTRQSASASPQYSAAVSVIEEPNSSNTVQKRRQYVQLEGLNTALKAPSHEFLGWLPKALDTEGLCPTFKAKCLKEMEGGPDTLSAALRQARNPPRFGTDRASVLKQMLLTHVLYQQKHCPLCPMPPKGSVPVMCTNRSCKWLANNVPRQVLERGLWANSADEQVVPLSSGQASAAPAARPNGKRNRDRYGPKPPIPPSPVISQSAQPFPKRNKRNKTPVEEHIC